MAGLYAPLPTLRRHPRGCQGTARTRTQDQSLKRALLYQLSYRPSGPGMIAELRRQFTGNASSAVAGRIGYAGGGKTGGTQAAGVALSAGGAVGSGLVARHGHGEVYAEFSPRTDDIRLRHVDERSLDFERHALDIG